MTVMEAILVVQKAKGDKRYNYFPHEIRKEDWSMSAVIKDGKLVWKENGYNIPLSIYDLMNIYWEVKINEHWYQGYLYALDMAKIVAETNKE